MRVCGIDIKANEIVICLLSLDRGLFEAPEIRQRRLNIANADDPKQLRMFQQTVSKLLQDYKVDKMAIKGRPQKGKFAGAASGFKLEAALQLMESHRAYLISAAVIKETLKYEPLPVDFKDTGLKAYQEPAFMAAYTMLVGPRHPPKVATASSPEEAEIDTPDSNEARSFKPTENPHAPRKVAASTEQNSANPSDHEPPKKSSPWGQKNTRQDAVKADKPAAPKAENPWKKGR